MLCETIPELLSFPFKRFDFFSSSFVSAQAGILR